MTRARSAIFRQLPVVASFALFTSCGQHAENLHNRDQKLIGGANVGMDIYPAAVSIWSHSGNTRQLCTATFVSDNTLITAAHCLYGVNRQTGESRSAILVREMGERRALRVFANPVASGVSPHDIAVAIFPDGTAESWLPVSTTIPAAGSRVDMVGYGSRRVWNGTDHERSAGSNTVDGTWNGLIATSRNDTANDDVAASPGDSGGPMIFEGALVGVSSGGSGGRESYHAPIGTPENEIFLRRMISEQGARIEGF